MPALNVVCLISGGKDSLFSILHCLANGHEVVALANLYPSHDVTQAAEEDIDSYMYQTIGHTVVPLYEKALGLPLYRQEIQGGAVNQDKCYDPSAVDSDEAEALLPLLERVRRCHPVVNAVSTGAILSDYQRTRVESVAIRLGLTPLSYLWQYPFLKPNSQTSLLEDMADVGQVSRIIKVASGGLDDSFLWQNVSDSRTISRLDKASKRFGSADDGAVLGEGGEYETLAVAGPAPLWKGRIKVGDEQRKTILGDAGSASVQILQANVKMGAKDPSLNPSVRIPTLLEPQFQRILDGLRMDSPETQPSAHQVEFSARPKMPATNGGIADTTSGYEKTGHTFLESITGEGTNVSAQMRAIMDTIQNKLRTSGKTFENVAYTSIILRDMADFPAINAVYGSYLVHPSPPARATIACAGVLPTAKYLMVSCLLTDSAMAPYRRGLHVQSRSYWAPANIGPYSQAISVPLEAGEDVDESALVYVAGQIPLVPASMELVKSPQGELHTFRQQTVLALQHAARIGRAMSVARWACAMAFITAESSEAASARKDIASQAWSALHHGDDFGSSNMDAEDTEDASFDVWDLKYGHGGGRSLTAPSWQERQDSSYTSATKAPPLHVIRVDALPRNANIEWVMYGLTKEVNTCCVPHFNHILELFRDNVV